MESSVFIALIVLTTRLLIATSTSCKTTFEVHTICPMTYGVVLEHIGNIYSVMACSELCATGMACRSCMYDPSTQMCQTNSKEAESTCQDSCNATVFYGKLEKGTCRSTWLSQPCTGDHDCSVVPNSACFEGTCDCDNAYSYMHRTDSCLASCHEYGSTFKAESYYLQSNNNWWESGLSLQECKELCKAYTPTCKSIEYITTYTECYISTDTGLTKPESYRFENYPHWLEFLRNCA